MKKPFLILALFLLIYIVPLGARPLMIPDEFRYAEIPREMITSGDWIVPRINGIRYFEKPIMGYWINALSILVFGENAFAVRFPSAAAVGISALLIFLLVRRFGGGRYRGLFSSIIYLTCLEVYAIGTYSVLDSVLSMFLTAAMVLFFFAYSEESILEKISLLFLFGTFLGLAFLTKGFLAFAVPVITIIPFMMWERQWKEVFITVTIATVSCLIIVLPWSLAIHFREPDFWNYFFWVEHVKRFLSDRAQHNAPFWYFIPIIIAGALPWTAMSPAAVVGMRKKILKNRLYRFALCWFLFPFLFFSVSNGKLETYILPCFPPLAILMSTGIQSYLEKGKLLLFRIGTSILSAVLLLIAALLIIGPRTGAHTLVLYGHHESWKYIVIILGLLVWTLCLIYSLRTRDIQKIIILYGLGPLLFLGSANFIVPDKIMEKKAPEEFLSRHSDRINSNSILVTSDLERAVCWCYRRTDAYILDNAGELTYGTNYDDSKNRLITVEQFRRLITKYRGDQKVTLITGLRHYEYYKTMFQEPIYIDISGRFVFAQY